MRRDLCYFYPMPVNVVFDAYVQAANQQFGKNCKIDAYKTINFGLNYSFKYNMNGGSVTAHFMPYQNGTAIDLRYTIVQAFGARYGKHAEDYTGFANRILGMQAQPIQLDINAFLNYEASTPSNVIPTASAQPMMQQAPVQQVPEQVAPVTQQPAQPAPQKMFCMNCGAKLVEGAMFCMNCGQKID